MQNTLFKGQIIINRCGFISSESSDTGGESNMQFKFGVSKNMGS
jgi:hypothetical protein